MEEEIIVNKGYLDELGAAELIGLPIYLILIVFIARMIQKNNIQKKPFYQFFTLGLYAKLLGTTAFCFIFTYYYKGGDSIGYYESARSFSNLFWQRPEDFFHVFFSKESVSNLNYFSSKTGYPWAYMYLESRTAFLIKIITPFVIISWNSYLLSSIVLSTITFSGIWQAYKMIIKYYPKYYKPIAYGMLFIPTVIFWGSGMLKDNITLCGVSWLIVFLERLFIQKKNKLINIVFVVLTAYVVIKIKPYIIMSLIPGLLVWVMYSRIFNLRMKLLRYLSIPFILIASTSLGLFILNSLGDSLGKFSLDKIIETTIITQDDLKREFYNGSSFDIGKIEPTPLGFLSKAPAAVVAGLFRPFMWEARNVMVFLSGIENFVLLLLVISALWKVKIIGVFRQLFNNPLLLFFTLYFIIFAFSIGISTSNFGALIRFKIAFAPFFVTTFIIMRELSKEKKKMVRQKNSVTPKEINAGVVPNPTPIS